MFLTPHNNSVMKHNYIVKKMKIDFVIDLQCNTTMDALILLQVFLSLNYKICSFLIHTCSYTPVNIQCEVLALKSQSFRFHYSPSSISISFNLFPTVVGGRFSSSAIFLLDIPCSCNSLICSSCILSLFFNRSHSLAVWIGIWVSVPV